MISATFCGSTSEAVRMWAGLTNMGLLVCGLMKHTNLVDIGLSSWVNAAVVQDTIQSRWASRTHATSGPPEGHVKGESSGPCVSVSSSCTLPILPRDGAIILSDVSPLSVTRAGGASGTTSRG